MQYRSVSLVHAEIAKGKMATVGHHISVSWKEDIHKTDKGNTHSTCPRSRQVNVLCFVCTNKHTLWCTWTQGPLPSLQQLTNLGFASCRNLCAVTPLAARSTQWRHNHADDPDELYIMIIWMGLVLLLLIMLITSHLLIVLNIISYW